MCSWVWTLWAYVTIFFLWLSWCSYLDLDVAVLYPLCLFHPTLISFDTKSGHSAASQIYIAGPCTTSNFLCLLVLSCSVANQEYLCHWLLVGSSVLFEAETTLCLQTFMQWAGNVVQMSTAPAVKLSFLMATCHEYLSSGHNTKVFSRSEKTFVRESYRCLGIPMWKSHTLLSMSFLLNPWMREWKLSDIDERDDLPPVAPAIEWFYYVSETYNHHEASVWH